MKKVLKIMLIFFSILAFVVAMCLLYIYKPNNLNPEDTVKKYISYWQDDFTIGMRSLESKEAEFVDIKRHSYIITKIDNIRIQDITNEEIEHNEFQYEEMFSKDELKNLKIYHVDFNVFTDDEEWEGEHTYDLRLIHERQGWCVLSFGHP